MSGKRKIIRIYDKISADADTFNKQIAEPVAPPIPYIEDLPFRAVTFLDAFTKSWCIDDAASKKEGDLLFRCHRCPFEDEGRCDVKRFRNIYAPWFEKFGAMSR